jgi:tetratricopeptide (TPR) repeat protein
LQTVAEIQVQGGLQAEAGVILKEALDAVHAPQAPYWPSCPRVLRNAPDASFYVELLCAVAKAQAVAGLMQDAAATLEQALQLVPTIKGSSLMKADFSRSLALSQIAAAESKAGLKPQSAATLERAAQASSEIGEAKNRVAALSRLGRTQHEAGRVQDAAGSFDTALALARGVENGAQRAGGHTIDCGQVRTCCSAEPDCASVGQGRTLRSHTQKRSTPWTRRPPRGTDQPAAHGHPAMARPTARPEIDRRNGAAAASNGPVDR